MQKGRGVILVIFEASAQLRNSSQKPPNLILTRTGTTKHYYKDIVEIFTILEFLDKIHDCLQAYGDIDVTSVTDAPVDIFDKKKKLDGRCLKRLLLMCSLPMAIKR